MSQIQFLWMPKAVKLNGNSKSCEKKGGVWLQCAPVFRAQEDQTERASGRDEKELPVKEETREECPMHT